MSPRIRQLSLAIAATCLLGAALASTAQAAAPAWAPVAITGPTVLPPKQSEVQTIWVDAAAGTYTLTFNAQTTAPIAFNAPASNIEAALNALSTIGGVGASVQVVPGSGEERTYAVAFGGSLANTDVAQISTDSSALSGGATHSAAVSPTVPGGAGTSQLALMVQNIGGLQSTGNITYKATLPAGVSTIGTPITFEGTFAKEGSWSCTTPTVAGQIVISCSFGGTLGPPPVGPGRTPPSIVATITSAPGTPSGTIHLEVSGGNAPSASTDLPLTIGLTPASPGLQVFHGGAYDDNGNPDTQAGDHPYSVSAQLFANTFRNARGNVNVVGQFKDIVGEIPPGFLGNPIAIPSCKEEFEEQDCPLKTIAGIVQPALTLSDTGKPYPAVNTEAPFGYPAKFRFNVLGLVPLNVAGQLRSSDDYGLNLGSFNTPQIAPVFGSFVTFWGAPANPSHDTTRCHSRGEGCGPSEATSETAFLTNATNCAEQAAVMPISRLHTTYWGGAEASSSIGIEPVKGCEKLHFEAGFTFEPSDTKSDSPASFRTELTVPSDGLTDPTKLTTPEIKNSVVKLPEGVVLNASGADGLAACSEQQIGFLGKSFAMPNPMHFDAEPNTCPEASKIGSGELKTALLEEPLHGALYLAAQGEGNPFGSLFAIYLVIEDPRHGIFIKLPGKVQPDERTGQMTVSFENLPQLPFTYLRLNLKGGNRSALASPTTCGNFVTTATNTPWSYPESGPPTESANGFAINQGPNGMPCAKTPAERPFDIGWKAGAQSNTAGASSPFNFQITRPDGSQEIDTLSLSTPPGLSASLKGVPYCTEAQIKTAEGSTGKQEQANPACPSASQVGHLEVGTGSGPTPFYTGGKLYLAGPYKGAPISVVSVVPAVAGPFDLGNVVSRNALFIDRQTAQVTAKSDPIPQIIDGVVLRIKDIRIFLNHKDWTLNPTSCDASSVDLTIHGNSGATAQRSAPFQVANCSALNFKPKLTAKVTGPTKRGKLPAFTATLTYPEGPGYANIKDVQVALPHSEFLEQAHINTICTRVQAAAHACPQGAIYGYAEAETPLLDGKLTGPVFLKSSDHQLPDLAIALKGPDNQPVEVEFQGRIDSIHGQIRNTIEGLPDVPVSKFVLKMKGGKKGLLVNSRNLCQGKPGRMTVDMVAQNNKRADSRPLLGNSCGKAKKHKQAKKHGKAGRRLSRLVAAW